MNPDIFLLAVVPQNIQMKGQYLTFDMTNELYSQSFMSDLIMTVAKTCIIFAILERGEAPLKS